MELPPIYIECNSDRCTEPGLPVAEQFKFRWYLYGYRWCDEYELHDSGLVCDNILPGCDIEHSKWL
jgi:hypothetical protein